MSCFAHNMFGFDLYFIIRDKRLSTWETEDLNIGGSNLANINCTNFTKLKFIDTYKYFQTSLSALAGIIDKKGENRSD